MNTMANVIELPNGLQYTRIHYKPWNWFVGGRPSRYRVERLITYKSAIFGQAFEGNHYRMDLAGLITAYVLFEWDGATYGIDTKNFMRASLFHDILCDAIDEGLLHPLFQPDVDQLLYDICRKDKMSYIRAQHAYRWVRGFQTIKHM